MDPKNFKKLINEKSGVFSKKEFIRIISQIDKQIDKNNYLDIKKIYWDETKIPNENNGFNLKAI